MLNMLLQIDIIIFKKVVFVPYKRGLVTATETQLISDEIKENDKLIVGFVGQESKNKNTMRGPRI